MSAKKYLSKINKGGYDIYIKDEEARTEVGGKENRVAIVTCTTSTLPQTLSTGTYYNITDAISTATFNLPSVTDNTKLSALELFFTTGSSTPTVTITPQSGDTVSYFSGYAIEASKSYELNILWNGTKWIVAYAVVE